MEKLDNKNVNALDENAPDEVTGGAKIAPCDDTPEKLWPGVEKNTEGGMWPGVEKNTEGGMWPGLEKDEIC